MKKIISIIALGLLLASCGGSTSFDNTKNISLYTRDTSSGTRDGFFTKIGLSEAKESDEPLTTVSTVDSNGSMILKIKNDEYGLGYISLSSLDKSGVKGLYYESIEPTEDNVLNKTYSLTRNFNYITRETFANTKVEQIVKAFIAYLDSAEGKATIIGNFGIVEMTGKEKSWDDMKKDYPICQENNKDITIKFGGSTSVERIAKALSSEFSPKCGNFIAEHNHTGSGDAYKYTQGAKKDDSAKLDIGFLSRELNSSETVATSTSGLICVDAIVAVVNKINPLNNVTATLLKDAYLGNIKTWSQMN